MWVKSTQFGSWTYDGTKLDLQPDKNGWDLSEYMINGEWNLYRELQLHCDQLTDEISQTPKWSAPSASTSAARSRTRL